MVDSTEVEIAEIKLSIHCIRSVLRVPPAAFLPLLRAKKEADRPIIPPEKPIKPGGVSVGPPCLATVSYTAPSVLLFQNMLVLGADYGVLKADLSVPRTEDQRRSPASFTTSLHVR